MNRAPLSPCLKCAFVATALVAPLFGGADNCFADTFHSASFAGGSEFDHARDIFVDAQGFIYLTGGTKFPYMSTTNTIVNAGTPESGSVDRMDIFVMKLDPSGQNILWSTRIGGPNYERAYAIEVDAQGYIYVAGRGGNNAPTTSGAFQTTFRSGMGAAFYGNQDGYVFKLTPNGQSLVWASYFGTDDSQSFTIIRDIALDSAGNVFLAASTAGGTYTPAVASAFLNSPHGGYEGVIAKIAANGASVLWAQYIGGSADEYGEPSVRTDSQGNAYFLTVTTSTDAVTTAGAYDRTFNGGSDFYLLKFQPGGALSYATFLGGSAGEGTETHHLAVDSQGNAVIAAGSTSTNYPTTAGAYDTSHNGNGGSGTGQNSNHPGDTIVSKVSSDGSSLLASTYLGGQFGESAEGMAVDSAGNVYLTGATYSPNFPVTSGAYQTSRRGVLDAFYARFSPDLKQLLYSTYFGGDGNDAGRAAAVGVGNHFFAVGEVGGPNAGSMPTQNAFQPAYGGNADSLYLRFQASGDTVPPAPPSGLTAH